MSPSPHISPDLQRTDKNIDVITAQRVQVEEV
jgi:hypothetical protein